MDGHGHKTQSLRDRQGFKLDFSDLRDLREESAT